MKPERASTTAPPESARVEFEVQFSTPHSVRVSPPNVTAPTESGPQKTRLRGRPWGVVPAGRPSRVALLLALAHQWERLVRDGTVKDYADIARLAGLTRARVTQIMDLLLLAPDIQEKALFHPECLTKQRLVCGRTFRGLSKIPAWPEQRSRVISTAAASGS
ncbi:MAG: hypothetical protein L0191_20525 [Acidobacteria bacterium]|nr:hypothetical protein [Acidobacteriota bacterium]